MTGREISVPANTSRLTVGGLEALSEYSVTVSARNSIGLGRMSAALFFTTHEEGKVPDVS